MKKRSLPALGATLTICLAAALVSCRNSPTAEDYAKQFRQDMSAYDGFQAEYIVYWDSDKVEGLPHGYSDESAFPELVAGIKAACRSATSPKGIYFEGTFTTLGDKQRVDFATNYLKDPSSEEDSTHSIVYANDAGWVGDTEHNAYAIMPAKLLSRYRLNWRDPARFLKAIYEQDGTGVLEYPFKDFLISPSRVAETSQSVVIGSDVAFRIGETGVPVVGTLEDLSKAPNPSAPAGPLPRFEVEVLKKNGAVKRIAYISYGDTTNVHYSDFHRVGDYQIPLTSRIVDPRRPMGDWVLILNPETITVDPKSIDEAIFAADFPSGSNVSDEVKGTNYRTP